MLMMLGEEIIQRLAFFFFFSGGFGLLPKVGPGGKKHQRNQHFLQIILRCGLGALDSWHPIWAQGNQFQGVPLCGCFMFSSG